MFLHVFYKSTKHVFMFFCFQINVFNIYGMVQDALTYCIESADNLSVNFFLFYSCNSYLNDCQ